MPMLQTRIDRNSEGFRTNREQMLALIGEFRELEQKVRDASNSKRDLFRTRGQLLPRERVALLLDRGAPWLELSTLAGYRMHDDDGRGGIQAGGGIAGVGYVSGIRCVVAASDSAIKGGTSTPMGVKKNLRVQQIALENKLPMVRLVESGGANLLYQGEMFVEGGRGFANQARMSAAGIPQVTVVHGSSTAGGAYLPGLSDYVILVRNTAKVFIARDIMAKLPWKQQLPVRAEKAFQQPRYEADELAGVVPVDYRKPYDVREVIARVVDDSDFLDFKALYGVHTVCGHAEIEGHAVGLIGNNGPIDADGSAKAAQFIQICCQANIPIVYLQNTTGYMVGREAEQDGIIKHGSKMIQAVANANVPQITLHIGASFGAGNYGMCGRAYDPRFIFAWPNNRIAVMGGEQAAKVMAIVTEEKLRGK